MEIDLMIDVLTPCLIEQSSGKIVDTNLRKIEKHEVNRLTRGWKFNWSVPIEQGFEVFGLFTDTSELQGMISIRIGDSFIEVDLVESAPHNFGSCGKYQGVGAHLFAYAAKLSFEMDFEGFVSFTSKTGLIKHYKDKLRATQIGDTHRMYLDSFAASVLVERYFSKGVQE